MKAAIVLVYLYKPSDIPLEFRSCLSQLQRYISDLGGHIAISSYQWLSQWPGDIVFELVHHVVDKSRFVVAISTLHVTVPEILAFPGLAATLLFQVVHQCHIYLGATSCKLVVVENFAFASRITKYLFLSHGHISQRVRKITPE